LGRMSSGAGAGLVAEQARKAPKESRGNAPPSSARSPALAAARAKRAEAEKREKQEKQALAEERMLRVTAAINKQAAEEQAAAAWKAVMNKAAWIARRSIVGQGVQNRPPTPPDDIQSAERIRDRSSDVCHCAPKRKRHPACLLSSRQWEKWKNPGAQPGGRSGLTQHPKLPPC
jgi:hypothetical protein